MDVCAFTKIALSDTFDADYPFDSDIEARNLCPQDDDEELLFGAFDVSCLRGSGVVAHNADSEVVDV